MDEYILKESQFGFNTTLFLLKLYISFPSFVPWWVNFKFQIMPVWGKILLKAKMHTVDFHTSVFSDVYENLLIKYLKTEE